MDGPLADLISYFFGVGCIFGDVQSLNLGIEICSELCHILSLNSHSSGQAVCSGEISVRLIGQIIEDKQNHGQFDFTDLFSKPQQLRSHDIRYNSSSH